jgi:copper homeostasis protein (lipoprotein)
MRGLFTYMADAAVFEDCVSGRRYPVAMEADYISVERAYLEGRSEPGAPLLVLIRARVEQRPPMEGDGEIDTVVVEGFEAAFPGDGCDRN